MLDGYWDIRQRIDEEPQWFDRHGVPRYCDPGPENCSDVYARQVAFVDIACQDCGQRFVVEVAWSAWEGGASLVERMAKGDIPHYGDPPAHGCVGDSMNVVEPRVVGLWRRDLCGWEKIDVEQLQRDTEAREKRRQAGDVDAQ